MNTYKVSWLTIFGIAAVSTIGFKAGNLFWDKIVEPKINKR